MIVMWLFTAAFNQNEYIYNALFIINFGLIIMLFLLNRDFLYSRKNSFWRVSLILTLGASYFDAVFFNNFTTFKETYTLIGYDNPLWAARDLGIIVFYFLLTSKKNQTLEVITILATMLFFLEARAAFLITLFLYFIRFTPLYLITGLSFLTVIYSFIIDINPYSIAKRASEWSNILSNINNIPLFGFGPINYADLSFTNLGDYPHNFVLDLVLGYGIVGLLFSIWLLFNIYKLLLLKDSKELHFLMTVPIFYVLVALSQGSLVSGMLGLCLIPFGQRLNKYLMENQVNSSKNLI